MRVMSLNLRFENDSDGENAWRYRKDLVVDVVHRCGPSVLGTQEGTPRQLAYLEKKLTGYRMLAAQRPADETCQYPTLFYRESQVCAKEVGELWLSKTPAVHRSKDWDSAFPRMMSYGFFVELMTGRRFWTIVTHLDHIGVVARFEQARLVLEWMCGRSEPKVLLGDFNDFPGSPVHRLMTGRQAALQDTWQALGREESEDSMTHHDFQGVPQKCRMDWILTDPAFRVADAYIVRDHSGGRYPSDHFPYVVDLVWSQ
ncbi:MAG: endonuclease/exonuclease/phosphatase family protein [Syntrophobacteraceae bacterium]